MRIHSTNLKKIAAEKGLDAARLGEVIAREGLKGDKAVSAVGNWMRGSDHPRCKGEDIKKMAAALGVEVKAIAKFSALFRYHRGSPRKASLLTDLVRGKKYETALNLLTFTTKRAAVDVKQALMAAYADAEQADADIDRLYVVESSVNAGPVLKRFQQKDRGRAHPIMKRMSHITVALAEKN
jgi:large subunit ribosomal protein L22